MDTSVDVLIVEKNPYPVNWPNVSPNLTNRSALDPQGEVD
jgi:hypothetical protein